MVSGHVVCDQPETRHECLVPKESLGSRKLRNLWTWLHKLRHAMVRPGRDRLSGTVEIDEIYMGGVKKGTYGREAGGKALVSDSC